MTPKLLLINTIVLSPHVNEKPRPIPITHEAKSKCFYIELKSALFQSLKINGSLAPLHFPCHLECHLSPPTHVIYFSSWSQVLPFPWNPQTTQVIVVFPLFKLPEHLSHFCTLYIFDLFDCTAWHLPY